MTHCIYPVTWHNCKFLLAAYQFTAADVAASSIVQRDIRTALLSECAVETVGKFSGRRSERDSNARLL